MSDSEAEKRDLEGVQVSDAGSDSNEDSDCSDSDITICQAAENGDMEKVRAFIEEDPEAVQETDWVCTSCSFAVLFYFLACFFFLFFFHRVVLMLV